MSLSHGLVAPGFEPVREVFERNFEDGLELGAGFAAWLGDELVVDLHGGFMDRAMSKPWTAETICPVFSTTKPVAALVVARLVDQGLLDYDAPVARYWPDFAANGKASVTVGQALSHQAGLPGFPEAIDPDLWLDPQALAAELAKQAPLWPPGEGSGYHPMTWGYIAWELVRRIDGRTLGQVLREDICGPLDIDFWIGTPESEHHRAAQLQKPKEVTRFAHANEATRIAFQTPWAAPARGGADWRSAELPSANGHGTASALARLYSAYALHGRIGEMRLISEATWGALTRARVSGADRVLPGQVSFGAGVWRNPVPLYGPNPETLCHSGWGGSGAMGDPETGLACGYVMNRQGSHLIEDERRSRLIRAVYACL
jgi:CubicO group peptidase (beta-lactamase class C family)